MMKNNIKVRLLHSMLPALALGTTLILEATPGVGATFAKPLATMIAQGKETFLHNTFAGRGMTCNSCHTGAGLGPTIVPGSSMKGPSLSNAAAVFPRYKPNDRKVMTLADEIHGCIQGALGGKAPAYDSDTMRALETYISSLAQGKRLNMGGKYK
jgi:thiosulfate dehydrogenase